MNSPPLWGAVTVNSGSSAWGQLWAHAWKADSAAVRWAEEGRAQRHCGQEATPITPGALVGEWHPLDRKRRAVCEDVRRRKKASKPDKASENQYKDCWWRTRETPKTLFQQENEQWWILPHFAAGSRLLVLFKTSFHSRHYFKLSIYLSSAHSGALGMTCASEETWWREKKVLGGHRDGFPSSIF